MSASAADDRPNVVFVLTDQQRWDTLGVHGNPHDLTPNLDAMADRGTHLERTFTPQPVCTPARACLQTGRYGSETGVVTNSETLPDDVPTLADRFGAAGYRTGYVGKWHLGGTGTDPVPEERRGGYDYWRVADTLEISSHPYEGFVYDGDGERIDFDGYRVDATTDLALDFVEEAAAGDDPFFCFLSILEPHHQNDMDRYVAPEGYDFSYRNPWVPGDLRNNPGDWYEELPDYYGICRRIDECVGRLRETLEAQGIAEETIVVFTSDHGSHFRTRNQEYKRSCHESSIRVPAVVDGPGFEDGSVDELVSLLDLPPTLLDTCGVDVPDGMQGRSLRPLLDGEAEEWREEALVQLRTAQLGRAIRTDRWKYAVHAPDADPDAAASEEYVERYLYDLDADPHERTNLAGRETHREIADELAERLRARIREFEGSDPEIVSTSLG